jgi:hypothetical protein
MPFFNLVDLRRTVQSPSIKLDHYLKDIMYLKAYCICRDVSGGEEARWLPDTQAAC